MRITLIKPRMGTPEQELYIEEGRMEPLTRGVIASLTPPDVDVVIDRLERMTRMNQYSTQPTMRLKRLLKNPPLKSLKSLRLRLLKNPLLNPTPLRNQPPNWVKL